MWKSRRSIPQTDKSDRADDQSRTMDGLSHCLVAWSAVAAKQSDSPESRSELAAHVSQLASVQSERADSLSRSKVMLSGSQVVRSKARFPHRAYRSVVACQLFA